MSASRTSLLYHSEWAILFVRRCDIALDSSQIAFIEAPLRIAGTKGKEGESGVTGTVVLTVLLGPIGLIKHGHNVEIQKGQALHAFVGDDIALPPVAQ